MGIHTLSKNVCLDMRLISEDIISCSKIVNLRRGYVVVLCGGNLALNYLLRWRMMPYVATQSVVSSKEVNEGRIFIVLCLSSNR
jgi:hypothetical protein